MTEEPTKVDVAASDACVRSGTFALLLSVVLLLLVPSWREQPNYAALRRYLGDRLALASLVDGLDDNPLWQNYKASNSGAEPPKFRRSAARPLKGARDRAIPKLPHPLPLLPRHPVLTCLGPPARWGRARACAGACVSEGKQHRQLITSTSSHSKRNALTGSRLAALCAGMNVAMAITSSETRGAATKTAAS